MAFLFAVLFCPGGDIQVLVRDLRAPHQPAAKAPQILLQSERDLSITGMYMHQRVRIRGYRTMYASRFTPPTSPGEYCEALTGSATKI